MQLFKGDEPTKEYLTAAAPSVISHAERHQLRQRERRRRKILLVEYDARKTREGEREGKKETLLSLNLAGKRELHSLAIGFISSKV